MKKYQKYILILIMLFISPLFVKAEECNLTYEEAQKMIQESMRAYYIRGSYFQYNTSKYAGINNGYRLPEEATSQENNYLVCSGFVHASMKTGFGMNDTTNFESTNSLLKYGKEQQNNKNLILFYGTNGTIYNGTYKNFVDLIEPGDIFVYTGHTMAAYQKVDTNNDGKTDDILLLHSWQAPYIKTRLSSTYRLSYNNFNGEHNYISNLANHKEGTIKQILLSDFSEFVKNGNIQCTEAECTVIRPFYDNNGQAKFNFATNKSNCEKTELRVNYPNLIIEKTVSVGDNNVVNVEDELTYTIKITNYNNTNSSISYENFIIEESIGNYVDYLSSTNSGVYSSGKVKWTISQLNANESITLTYTVKVKNNLNNLNQTIESTGKFYNSNKNSIYITTGTVKNIIVPKVTKFNSTYKDCYTSKKTNFSGLKLIDEIYKCATGQTFNFSEIKFENLFTKSGEPKKYSIVLKDETQLDDNHKKFKNMILNNYFSGLTIDYTDGKYYLPKWVSYSSPERAKTINLIDFKDGDVLIYNIKNSEHTYENGTYAYIYLKNEGKFVGVNGSGITTRNEFFQTYYAYSYWQDNGFSKYLTVANNLYEGDWNNTTSFEKKFINYQTLYDKDNYVILRPELIIKETTKIEISSKPTKLNYIQNKETLDLTGGNIKVIYNDGTTNTIPMTNTNVTTSGFSNSTVETKTITVTYNGHTTNFNVNIISKQATKIEIASNPTKTSYIQNYENLDLTGGTIKVIYNDSSTDIIPMTNTSITVSGFSNSTVGTKNLTVTYNGHTTTFDVNIISKQITKIEVANKPTKLNYIQNKETLDLTGGSIKVIYNDNTTDTISMTNTNVTTSGFSNNTVGTKPITVTYNGHTTTFDVNIISKQVTKIEIETKPTKLNYIQNYENLDLTGGSIKVTYNDNTTDIISMTNANVITSGFSNSTVGMKTITVTYEGKTTNFNIEIITKQITRIEVANKPTKINYIQNKEILDLTGGSIKVIYNDNSTDTISMTNTNVITSGFNNSSVGNKIITVTYKEKTTTFVINIISKQVTKIEIETKPTKINYIQNYENLDLTGGSIKVTYNDNSTDTISMTNTNVTTSGFSNSSVGDKTITVTYEEKTTTFIVNIISKQVTKMEIDTKPIKLNYIQNKESLDLTGGKIKVTYNDNTTDIIPMTNANVNVSGFSNGTVGTKTITITYEGKTTNFDVEIISKQVTKIEIETKPTKINYIQNKETLDLTGGKMKVTYNDNSTGTISMTNANIIISGFNNSTVGTKTITITYEGKTTNFDVEIISKQVTKIEIETKPTKINYIQNKETLDLTGGKIKVTYNDNSTGTISMTNTNVTISGFDNSSIGNKTITVTYEGKTTTFIVNIISKQVTKIEVETKPTKLNYIQNKETLDLTGGKIKVIYNDNSTDIIPMTNANVNVSGFNNSTVGIKIITVTYEGYNATFDIEIIKKEVTKIEIETKPTKLNYIQNKEILDLTGGKIKITYNDNTTDIIPMTNANINVNGFSNSTVGTKIITVTYEGYNTTFDIEIISKQVAKIEVETKPTKINYIQNKETLDLTGGKIKVTYNDNSTDTISMTNANINVNGFSNSTVGTKIITITYEGKTTNFDIEIISKQVAKIEVETKPIKLNYIQNYENLDLTGGSIKVTYNDETTDKISMTNINVTMSGFSNSTVGTKIITITYEGKTTSFNIEIISKQVTKIEIANNPIKTNYIQNYENLDLTEGSIKVTYSDNSTDTINMDNKKIEISGFDNSKVGTNTITVTYEGCSITFDIEIISKQVTKIEIATWPTKLKYIQNKEYLDLTGGNIKVTYNDGSIDTIPMTYTNVKANGFDNSKTGKNTITVKYESYTTTFDIEIISKQATKIEIISKPNKTNYIQNDETLDLTGGKIKVTYNDGTTDKISMTNSNVKINDFDNSKIGKNTITVTYEGKTTTFDIEIISKQIIKIEINSNPTKTNYNQNDETLDLTGGSIKVVYNDETTDIINMDNQKIKTTGFDNIKVGTNTITVTYEGHKATFDIEITKGPENVEENPKTGVFNIIIIVFTSVIALISSYLFYKKYRLNIEENN